MAGLYGALYPDYDGGILMQKGFTLIELAISLTIIGLLVAGVLGGQELVKVSKVNNIISEMQGYIEAAQTFQDKYKALPGDMPNATKYWGDNNTVCADAAIANGTPGTCNGNGNNHIIEGSAASQEGERFTFWQHLQLARLIEAKGQLTGIAGPASNNNAILNQNIPASQFGNNTGYGIDFQNFPGGSGSDFPYVSNRFWFGAAVVDNLPVGPALTPSDLKSIDDKIDDGLPGTGQVMTWREPILGNCSTSNGALSATADAAQAVYKVSYTDPACAFYRIVSFY
jgi:prepilin-type N-terminal cleavage/methylation domain-containing protein